MPWDQEVLARYPRLMDRTIRGQRMLSIAQRAWHKKHPAGKWEELNPQMRDYWVDMTETILEASILHAASESHKVDIG